MLYDQNLMAIFYLAEKIRLKRVNKAKSSKGKELGLNLWIFFFLGGELLFLGLYHIHSSSGAEPHQ